jgi:creatinine amidohydrolase
VSSSAHTAPLWIEQTREDISEFAADDVLLIPVGAVEQHGPHLPTGTDLFIVDELARRAAALVSTHTVVAPAITLGSSHHHLPFGATISLESSTLTRLLGDVLKSACQSGFHRIFLLNGHGGNTAICDQIARDASLAHSICVGFSSYWDFDTEGEVFSEFPLIPGHAGMFETSVMLALRPELVRSERARKSLASFPRPRFPLSRFEDPRSWQAADGFTDDPREADAELGRAALDHLTSQIAAALDEFADLTHR